MFILFSFFYKYELYTVISFAKLIFGLMLILIFYSQNFDPLCYLLCLCEIIIILRCCNMFSEIVFVILSSHLFWIV